MLRVRVLLLLPSGGRTSSGKHVSKLVGGLPGECHQEHCGVMVETSLQISLPNPFQPHNQPNTSLHPGLLYRGVVKTGIGFPGGGETKAVAPLLQYCGDANST